MGIKRVAESSSTVSRTRKKSKAGTASIGQKSLKSFFQPSPTKAANGPDRTLGKGKSKISSIEIIDVDLEDEVNDASTAMAPEPRSRSGNGDGSGPLQRPSPVDLLPNYAPSNLPDSTVAGPDRKQRIGILEDMAGDVSSPLPKLNTDPLEFDISSCPWNRGKPAPYAFLTHTFVQLSSTRSRILLVNTLVNTLRLIVNYDSESLLATLYLLSNSISPSYDPLELNIGPSILSKALQSVSGLSSAALRKL